MSKEVVFYMLSGMDNMKSLQVQLILQCAPFLKGIKIACILNITEENSRELYEILEGTGIKFKILTRIMENVLYYCTGASRFPDI